MNVLWQFNEDFKIYFSHSGHSNFALNIESWTELFPNAFKLLLSSNHGFLRADDTKTETLATICSQSLLYTQHFEEHTMRMSWNYSFETWCSNFLSFLSTSKALFLNQFYQRSRIFKDPTSNNEVTDI